MPKEANKYYENLECINFKEAKHTLKVDRILYYPVIKCKRLEKTLCDGWNSQGRVHSLLETKELYC